MREVHRTMLLSITIASADADKPIDSHHGGASRGKDQQDAIGRNKEGWRSIVSASAKLLLYTVRDSADAFPPLKSVAGGLCCILENVEVRFIYHTYLELRCLESSQRAQGNKEAIESLAPRIKSLAESLCAPVPEGDAGEELRRRRLER